MCGGVYGTQRLKYCNSSDFLRFSQNHTHTEEEVRLLNYYESENFF